MKLYDKPIAIVTGGLGLMGSQHVIALCEIGYKVYVFDNDKEKSPQFYNLLHSECISPEDFEYFDVDLIHENKIKEAIDRVFQSTGRIDLLINNAALNPVPREESVVNYVEDFDVDYWKKELDVGLTAGILMVKHVLPHMKFGGIILNIASDLSVIAPDQRIYSDLPRGKNGKPFVKPLSYSIVKTGIVGLTRYLATYLAPRGIRVNCLSPGGVFVDQDLNFVSKLESLIPMGRMAHLTEYRGAIKFLCTSESSYMTGHNLIIDGGRSVW